MLPGLYIYIVESEVAGNPSSHFLVNVWSEIKYRCYVQLLKSKQTVNPLLDKNFTMVRCPILISAMHILAVSSLWTENRFLIQQFCKRIKSYLFDHLT